MTIKTSGPLSMAEIDAEFRLGTNLYAYRGVKWFKDDGSRGYFDQAMGNNPPIDMLEFYGKRKTIPVTPSDRYYANGEYFTVPFFNQIIVTMIGGQAGGRGNDGSVRDGCGGDASGVNGDAGGATKFGIYASSPGGSPNLNYGPTVIYTMNAETGSNFLPVGVPILVTLGGGGSGGRGGDQRWKIGNTCYDFGKAGGGTGGNPGSLRIQVL